MKLIVTTSDKYHHLIPVFAYLLNKNWQGQQVELVGYKEPPNLPDNFKFSSLGEQGTVNEWSTDLRRYFEAQGDDYFLWMMEDTLIKSVDENKLTECYALMMPGVGRIGLTKDIHNREHTATPGGILYAHPESKYRLSTQPSIWNKEFLLQYMTDGLSPWAYELQPTKDNWHVVTTDEPAITHNEGVRRRNIHELDLNGFSDEEINHIKTLV